MKKVAFYTLGCKLNFSETSTIARIFEEKGYKKADFTDTPDIFIINTCSVTNNADKKCKKIVKEARKISPDAYITIIGCYAQLKPKEIADIPGVDAVLGASEKFRLVELLDGFVRKKETVVLASDIADVNQFNHAYSKGDRTRTFLKVQDGCDYTCTFCTIPLARGKSRSNSIESIIKYAEEIATTDIKEVVLTGVNIGDFGLIEGRRRESFLGLVQMLDKVNGLNRFRISSIEPNLLHKEIIDFVASSEKFVPHFHIPLQSGSNKILKLMRRRYLKELYVERINYIKAIMPECCIGVDVIVGFPGETDEDFLETYNFLNALDISYLHVFSYSERPNTLAFDMENVVPLKVRSKRSKMLRSLSEKKRRKFYQENIGKQKLVLFEEDVENGFMHGFTENYIRVKAKYDPILINELKPVMLTRIDADGIMEVDETETVALTH